MRKILDIYDAYKIKPNLREHMFRVAAVGKIICDSFDIPLDTKTIITACLLHDMGNIIKFRLDVFPEWNEPEGIEYWKEVQDHYIQKYGTNENTATYMIMEELGFGHLVPTVKAFGFHNACKNVAEKDFARKICYYSDLRVGPYGIISFQERMIDGKKRYEGFRDVLPDTEREKIANCLGELEQQIFSHCSIKPENINDISAASTISELKNFVIQ